MANAALPEYTLADVAQHNKAGDIWVVIDAKVYDLSKFANLHPGGPRVLYDTTVAGKDATDVFFGLHRQEVLYKPAYRRLKIGTVKGQSERILPREPGELRAVPYAEPLWLTPGFKSPYFNESHHTFRREVRKFMDTVVVPDGEARDSLGKTPDESIFRQMAELNIIAMRLGPGDHLKGLTLMNGTVKPEEFDYFHEMILTSELCNPATRGYNDGLLGGLIIGLPALMNYGSATLKAKIMPDLLQGKKFISLAISEAFAGSDVAGLRTTATRTRDGKSFVVTGTKKWITNGTFADYFVTPCKTDKGITVLLVPRTDNVTSSPIKTSYSSSAGTALVFFDEAIVPAENIIGPEHGGLIVILANFNHERWMMTCATVRIERAIVEECFQWASQRVIFGKSLLEQPVVRAKLATMIARVETSQGWLEQITYNMNHMPYKEQAKYLAGPIALLKMHTTRSAQLTASDAVQLFGGRGITPSGLGRVIEAYHRTIPTDATLGGAEDVLADLGVRQAMKYFPKNSRL